MNASQCYPHVHCYRHELHEPHTHINEAPHGGCGLPEWCDGRAYEDQSEQLAAARKAQLQGSAA